MTTQIFIYELKRPGCDLLKLKRVDDEFVLVTTHSNFAQYTDEDKANFDRIELIEDFKKEQVYAAVAKIVANTDPNDIRIICGTEMVIQMCALVRAEFGLAGDDLEYALRFSNKFIAKQKLHGSAVRVPAYQIYDPVAYKNDNVDYIDALESTLGYPMFVKPTDLYCAIDSVKIGDRSDLQAWLDDHKEPKHIYEIDEFISGDLYHCDSLIEGEEILYSLLGEYAWPCDFFAKGYPLGSIVVPPDSEKFNRLNAFNKAVLTCMQPRNCATHLEIFEKEDRQLYFLEMGARPPAGPIVPLYAMQWQLDMNLMHYASQLGIKCQQQPLSNPERYYAWAYFPITVGTIKKINRLELKSKMDFKLFVDVGDHFSVDYFVRDEIMFLPKYIAGQVFFSHNDYDQLYADFETVRNFKLLEYED